MNKTRIPLKENKVSCPNCNTYQCIHKYSSNNFQIYFCNKCLNGFTHPVPKDLSKYYSDRYWLPKGPLGALKDMLYRVFQTRRKLWVTKFIKQGEILDVGSGEGIFSKMLRNNFNVTSLDIPSAKIINPKVIKADFLKWNPKRKFEAVVFWESLEHTALPQKYLEKATSILKPGGYIFVEYPTYNCWESNIFKSFWFHLDPPRHLSHLTPTGLDNLLKMENLTAVYHTGVFAPEYAIGGLIVSILNLFPKQPTDFFQSSKNLLIIIILIPLIGISALIETAFFLLGQSPIYVTVAKRAN